MVFANRLYILLIEIEGKITVCLKTNFKDFGNSINERNRSLNDFFTKEGSRDLKVGETNSFFHMSGTWEIWIEKLKTE